MPLPKEKLELGFKICQGITLGQSVKVSAENNGSKESTFFTWLTQSKELVEEYTRVRQFRADARYESIDNLLAELRSGEIDAHTARVMIDTVKWQCGKEKGGVYGDSTQIRHSNSTGTDNASFNVGVSFVGGDTVSDTK